jgi:hypothetical protein
VTNDDRPGWYSVSVEYKPIPSELRPGRGEWFLQTTLIHEYRDPSGGIQTEKTPLGSIDVDHIDSVELRQAFYAVTDDAQQPACRDKQQRYTKNLLQDCIGHVCRDFRHKKAPKKKPIPRIAAIFKSA